MKALLQRVKKAHVSVDQQEVGRIDSGLLVFLAIEKEDTPSTVQKLLKKILAYRIFADDQGKMNLSLNETQGGLLVVSQFTLAADTQKGLRPSFSSAAPPDQSELLYNHFIELAQDHSGQVASGQFAADMQVELINDGPVTFMLDVSS